MAGEQEGRQRKRDWLKPSKWLELYSRWVYKRPLTVLALIAAVLILCTIGTMASSAMDITDEGDPWTLKENEHAQRDEAITEAEDQLGAFITQSKRSDDHEELKLSIIYKATKGDMNMFTEENLDVVREVENTMLMNPKYNDFCELNYTNPDSPKCVTQQTPLHFFFEFDEEHPERGFGNLIRTPAEGLAIMSEDFFTNGFFLTKDFAETGNTSSLYTQSRYSFGLPVANFTNSNEEDDDQVEYVYDNFLDELEDDLWELLGMDAANFFRTEYSDTGSLRGTEVVFGAFAMINEEFERAVWKDFTWAFLSLFSVWLYMMFHLGSVFLSVVGAFEVFMAFPTGLFIYRTLFQVDYFEQLHMLIIFILLGLGADDVFVFTDAFKQSENMPGVGKSLLDRLQYTAHRASKAVFVTSFTTAAAFFATATSELMPMKAFGIFAGICIVVLFLINVLVMPAALVLWAGYTPWCVKKCCCCCVPLCNQSCMSAALPCCTCCHVNDDPGFADPESLAAPVGGRGDGEAASIQSGEGSDSTYSAPRKQAVEGHAAKAIAPPAGVEAVENMRPLERFFNGSYFNFLKRSRFAIILIGFVLFGTGLYFVTTLEPPKEAEEWWPSWHNFHKLADLTDRGGPFLSEDEDSFSTVHLAWGLKGFDQSGRDIWDPEDFGTLEYDKEFDMSSPAAQRHLLGVCARARETPCEAKACDADEDGNKFLVRFDRSRPDSFERCWIEDFNAFVQNSTELGYPEGLPVNATDFIPILKDFMATETFLLAYQGQVGLFTNEEGDDLRFVQFELTSTYRPPTSHSQIEPVLNEWEDFMKEQNAEAAANGAVGVSRGFQTGRYAWVWLWSQKALIDNAVQGIFIVFAIAFIVLNMATGNVVISVLAIMTVAGVVTSVMGLGVGAIMDWEFGITESIVSIILVGFSMDYSLHLADSYIESERFGRLDRTQDSLTRLGISVTAGAVTTLISGLFLWGAILTFFTKFAFMITSTIVASYLWSMLFFPAMAMTFGPEGEFGNWSAMTAAVRNRWAARQAQEKQDQNQEMA